MHPAIQQEQRFQVQIYNIFNTEKILNRMAEVAISNTSGLAGVAYWINKHYNLSGDAAVSKYDDVVVRTKQAIDTEYDGGRTTLMGDDEIHSIIRRVAPGFAE